MAQAVLRSQLPPNRFPLLLALLLLSVLTAVSVRAEVKEVPSAPPPTASITREDQPSPSTDRKSAWRYGGFVDLGYSLNFNFPENHLWRNRSTTPRVNELDLNMGAVYLNKEVNAASPWGMEFLVQGGEDAKEFGVHAGQPKVSASDQLRHFGRANISYLAPIGKGLTIQGGLFNSLIGYDSLYAKDNIHYTRPWVGDFSPYLMFGTNATYPVTEQLNATVYVINGYFHLSHPNALPSYGGQLAYKPTSNWTIKETILYGPEQGETAIEFWRLFFDTIVEWKTETLTVAFENQSGTETVASLPGQPRVFWTGGLVTARWNFSGPWSVAVRPEFYWDRNGRLTGFEQFVKAITSTLEYRTPYQWSNAILRLEHRFDESRGAGGGFFKGGQVAPGIVGLTPSQHMLIFSAIWTFDSP